MNKILSILATFLLLPCIASAVIFRENEQGQMLVSKMTVTKNGANGARKTDYKLVYEFTYDDDTDDLLKVVRTRNEDGHSYKEILERNGDDMKYNYYVDNKLQSNLKREYKFDPKEKKIKLYKETEDLTDRGGICKDITIVQYSGSFNCGHYRKLIKMRGTNTVHNLIRDIKYGDYD